MDINAELKLLNIELVYMKLECKGCYIPGYKTIFVNEELSEIEARSVIYHELGHIKRHTDMFNLYDSPTMHSKMEYEANQFMIDNLIADSDGHYNYSQVLDIFKLGMGWQFKTQ